jgi:hypothetical protein
MSKSARKDPNRYPIGWTAERVKAVIKHYESQTADDAIAEADRAFVNAKQEWMAIPLELVPVIRELLARFKDRRNEGRTRQVRRATRSVR